MAFIKSLFFALFVVAVSAQFPPGFPDMSAIMEMLPTTTAANEETTTATAERDMAQAAREMIGEFGRNQNQNHQ